MPAQPTMITCDDFDLNEFIGMTLDLTAAQSSTIDDLLREYLRCGSSNYNNTADLDWWIRHMIATTRLSSMFSNHDLADVGVFACLRCYGL